MPIRYYGGVEGSGKSCMMARDALLHFAAGGRVFAFPGFELYGATKKDIISELLLPEQWVSFPDTLKRNKVAICIEEVEDWFNHHSWQNKMNDMITSIMAKRRKYEASILMTGPIFETLPPDVKSMIHEVVHCRDLHTLNHGVKRGQICSYFKEDRRGLISNPNHPFSHTMYMKMPPWYNHYDTLKDSDFMNQFTKIKFQARQITIGADGQVIEKKQAQDTSTLEGVLRDIRQRGRQFVESDMLAAVLHVPNLMAIGRDLKKLGVIYNRTSKVYDLSGISA